MSKATTPLNQTNARNMQSQQDKGKIKPPAVPQQINVDFDLNIRFTPAALSVVISHLQEGSFKQVQPVLNDIERQIMEQVQTKNKADLKAKK